MIVNEREGATPPEKRRTAAMAIAAAEVPRMTKQGHLIRFRAKQSAVTSFQKAVISGRGVCSGCNGAADVTVGVIAQG